VKRREALVVSATPANSKISMMRSLFISAILAALISCKPTKKIQTAIIHKDTTGTVMVDRAKADSIRFINDTYHALINNHVNFQTFSAKLNVDYIDADDKKYNVNATLRMYKDSIIWVSVNAIFGIEGLRALITKDSVKILDKQNRLYTRRSIEYLQDVSALPVDLATLQDMVIGNTVFLDSNIVSYAKFDNSVSLLSIGRLFKNLVTVNEDNLLQRIKGLIFPKLARSHLPRKRNLTFGSSSSNIILMRT
jgi:uncharacterized protein DUF4292